VFITPWPGTHVAAKTNSRLFPLVDRPFTTKEQLASCRGRVEVLLIEIKVDSNGFEVLDRVQ